METDKHRIAAIRTDYTRDELLETAVADDPILQFHKWFEEALSYPVIEPNAMSLSTVSPEGKPAARIVLLKGFDQEGFAFFTNYESRKGLHLLQSQHAALLFFWPELQRQIRIEGSVSKMDEVQSDEYFASRPKDSRIGAWASPQSRVIQGRQILEEKVKVLETKYQDQELVPRPSHWGGFVLSPSLIEFWQGRASRLHDRLVYTRDHVEGKQWSIERLAP